MNDLRIRVQLDAIEACEVHSEVSCQEGQRQEHACHNCELFHAFVLVGPCSSVSVLH